MFVCYLLFQEDISGRKSKVARYRNVLFLISNITVDICKWDRKPCKCFHFILSLVLCSFNRSIKICLVSVILCFHFFFLKSIFMSQYNDLHIWLHNTLSVHITWHLYESVSVFTVYYERIQVVCSSYIFCGHILK